MADLTNDAYLEVVPDARSEQLLMDTSAAQTIYKGCPVIIDQSVDTLHVRTAAGVTVAVGDVFVGIAAGEVEVDAGDAETTRVELYTDGTIVGFKSAVFSNADMGKAVFMSDTATLTAAAGTYPEIGNLYLVKDGMAYVKINAPFVIDTVS